MSPNTITPEALIRDNHSPQVKQYLENWQENFNSHDILVVLGCSESRLFVPRIGIADVRSIGAAAVPEFYKSTLSNKFNPRAVIVVVHHDGETVRPGKMPSGCGGLGVKAMQELEDEKHGHPKEFSEVYVYRHIIHQDPFIQGVFTGEEIAELTRRPVLVVTEDHRTGKLYPLASFLPKYNRDFMIRSAIPLRSGFEGRYDPKNIYKSGIPYLKKEDIPDEFIVFMSRYNTFVENVKKTNPKLYQNQKLINPSVVALTTEIRPIQARFPTLLGEKPNTVFTVTIQRETPTKEDNYKVNADSMHRAFDQLHYAFEHALKHKGNSKLAFSRLYNQGTLLIEGDSVEQLEILTKSILDLPYIKRWIKLKNSKIITLDTSKGRVQTVNQLTL